MNWLDAQQVIAQFGGYAVLVLAVFVFFETAFIFTSFLPGDSLLFVLGLTLSSALSPLIPFPLAVILVWLAAVSGSWIGYRVGLRVGPPLFERNHNWIFNPRVVKQTHELFERYGARAIIVARFVPIIRALVPMLAGISYLEPEKFRRYNLIGGTAWVVGFMCAGFFLGEVPFVRDHLEQTVLVIVVLTSLPFPIELLRHWLRARREKRTAV